MSEMWSGELGIPGELRIVQQAEPEPTAQPTPEVVLDEPEPTPATPEQASTFIEDDSEEPLGGTLTVALTFYVCTNAPPGQSYCGRMSSGAVVYEGAAACGGAMALGTRFSIVGEGRVYVCEDRGAGPYYWIDIFHYDYYAGRAWRDQWPESVEIQVLP